MKRKMRKLVIKDYKVPAVLPDGTRTEHLYDVRGMIDMITLASTEQQRLGFDEAIKRGRVTQKIVACEEDFILLEENEFQYIDKAFRAFKGYGRNELKLLDRIKDCETIEVQEKKKKVKKAK